MILKVLVLKKVFVITIVGTLVVLVMPSLVLAFVGLLEYISENIGTGKVRAPVQESIDKSWLPVTKPWNVGQYFLSHDGNIGHIKRKTQEVNYDEPGVNLNDSNVKSRAGLSALHDDLSRYLRQANGFVVEFRDAGFSGLTDGGTSGQSRSDFTNRENGQKGNDNSSVHNNNTPVPVPPSVLLLGGGLLCTALFKRRIPIIRS